MVKNTQKSSYFVKKSHLLAKNGSICAIFLFILLLCGCTKTAPESATDAVLAQVGVVEQVIKKDCPAVKIDEQMNALRATVQSQLKSCESKIETVESQRNTWVVVSGGLLLVMIAYFLGKSHKIV